jgi:hypothetical protein
LKVGRVSELQVQINPARSNYGRIQLFGMVGGEDNDWKKVDA